ncbi:MAG: hypothetical protein L6R38_005111 [Xanthoria sp. 2 TBL-2021]|nr:MAG: hypothetical protein L6R38_005111 [Xanthoria sp. 2 TBL-2021]
MRVKTEDSPDMGTASSSERLATTNAVSEHEPQGNERSYEQILQEARRDYPDTPPPFLHSRDGTGAGDRREIVLATSNGQFPHAPSSVEIVVARRWDHRRFCFWTLDHGGDRLILAARSGAGISGGCKYLQWLGKGRGRNGFSESIYAYSVLSAKVIARFPYLASRSTVKPLAVAPPPGLSTQEPVTQASSSYSKDEVMADASTVQALDSNTTRMDKKRPEEPSHTSNPKKKNKLCATQVLDVEEMLQQDRAFFGNEGRPPYVEKRKDRHRHYRSSFTAFSVDKESHAAGPAIQVLSRNWNNKYRCWTVELDGKVRIVQKCRGGMGGFRLRLWLGHKHGLGEVVGLGNSTDNLKSGDMRLPELSPSDGPSEEPRPAKRSARPPNALVKGKRPTRNSELPLSLETIEHQDRTLLYSESSSGSEYEDSDREDIDLNTSREPSTPPPTKKQRTGSSQEKNKRLRGRTGLATPDSTSATRTLSPPQPSTLSRSTASPYPTIETRSMASLRTSSVASRAKSTVAINAELPSNFLGTRKRPYPTIEKRSVSHLRASNGGRASSARSQPNETMSESPEIPFHSPFNGEQSKEKELAQSDSESVVFCGSAEMQARPEVSDFQPPSPAIPRSRGAAAEKQELARRERQIRQDLRDLLYEELRDVKAQQERLVKDERQ